ncbi:MAG: glycerol-3-phosphate acyltransferase, partial [Acidimicrobiia bacterium]
MSDVGDVAVGLVVGYLIGMFPSADLVTRVATRGAVDLRGMGSGNPGGLNAARVLGKKWGLLVIV